MSGFQHTNANEAGSWLGRKRAKLVVVLLFDLPASELQI
jgi:hypothetical protein